MNFRKLFINNRPVANNHLVGRCLGSNPQILSRIKWAACMSIAIACHLEHFSEALYSEVCRIKKNMFTKHATVSTFV
jgi:hypothetical protein